MEKGKLYKNKLEKKLVILCTNSFSDGITGVVVDCSKDSQYKMGDFITDYLGCFEEYIGQLDLNNAFDR